MDVYQRVREQGYVDFANDFTDLIDASGIRFTPPPGEELLDFGCRCTVTPLPEPAIMRIWGPSP